MPWSVTTGMTATPSDSTESRTSPDGRTSLTVAGPSVTTSTDTSDTTVYLLQESTENRFMKVTKEPSTSYSTGAGESLPVTMCCHPCHRNHPRVLYRTDPRCKTGPIR